MHPQASDFDPNPRDASTNGLVDSYGSFPSEDIL